MLAIAITLPIVELHLPQVGPDGNLLATVAKIWPSYLAYAMSFLVVGIYWARSHFLGKILAKTDHIYDLLNLLFLDAVSLLPFPTRAFVDQIEGDANTRTGAILYAAVLLVPTLLWTLKWLYAAGHHPADPRLATVIYVESRILTSPPRADIP